MQNSGKRALIQKNSKFGQMGDPRVVTVVYMGIHFRLQRMKMYVCSTLQADRYMLGEIYQTDLLNTRQCVRKYDF